MIETCHHVFIFLTDLFHQKNISTWKPGSTQNKNLKDFTVFYEQNESNIRHYGDTKTILVILMFCLVKEFSLNNTDNIYLLVHLDMKTFKCQYD